MSGIFQDVLEDIEEGRSADIDGMDEAAAFLIELYDVGNAFEHHFKDPDAHIKVGARRFYSAYVQTVRDHVNYWLSDIELLCLCACRRQSVVILKHEAGSASFIYQDSVIFDGAAVAFTKFGVRPGHGNVRTHFEKVMRSPIVGESDAAPPGPSSQSSDPEHAKRKRADDSDPTPPAAHPSSPSQQGFHLLGSSW